MGGFAISKYIMLKNDISHLNYLHIPQILELLLCCEVNVFIEIPLEAHFKFHARLWPISIHWLSAAQNLTCVHFSFQTFKDLTNIETQQDLNTIIQWRIRSNSSSRDWHSELQPKIFQKTEFYFPMK